MAERCERFESRHAVCPFYRAEESRGVICEGLFDKSIIRTTFDTKEGKVQHANMHCYGDYKSCALAKMLFRKYE